jgi:ribA/ribD-fused uncharacterized protein
MEYVIDSFTGEYAFLSNFYPCLVFVDDTSYPCVENAYQASKTLNVPKRALFGLMTPGQAKRAGKKLLIRPDWNEVKESIMYKLLMQKFSMPWLREKLVATHGHSLVEGNTWGDKYWGVCNNEGLNRLGIMLENIRDYWLNMKNDNTVHLQGK